MIKKVALTINSMGEKERLFVMIATMLVATIIWWFGAISPFLSEIAEHIKQKNDLTQSIALLSGETSSMQTTVQTTGEISNTRLQMLKAELNSIEEKLTNSTNQYVQATKMPELIQSLIAKSDPVKLVKMKNLKPEAVWANKRSRKVSSDNKEGVTTSSVVQTMMRHGMEIEVLATFQQAVTFLIKSSKLNWKIDWESMHYEVKEYPHANIRFKLYTYSTAQSLIEL